MLPWDTKQYLMWLMTTLAFGRGEEKVCLYMAGESGLHCWCRMKTFIVGAYSLLYLLNNNWSYVGARRLVCVYIWLKLLLSFLLISSIMTFFIPQPPAGYTIQWYRQPARPSYVPKMFIHLVYLIAVHFTFMENLYSNVHDQDHLSIPSPSFPWWPEVSWSHQSRNNPPLHFWSRPIWSPVILAA